MTAPKARTAAERHAQAKVAIPQVEKRIDDLLERRRQILRAQDANALDAIRVDREIVALRALRLRLIDQVTLLEPIVGREQQAARKELPTTREQALARLQALEPRLVQLDSIPWNARHAGLQAELDTLRQQQYYFTGLLRTLPAESDLA